MAAVLGPLTKWLKKFVPADVQLIFVPFIAMLIMIPLTSFILGPIGVYVGAGLSKVLLAINNVSPFIFCLLIPLAYPFMVPLGLHWPINAVMLLNIQQNGFDFIQGPMGAWNFACFGATAGVLVLAVRHKEKDMRVTATGALFAGLVGGISEPSLYGIHLRYKRIYPRLLVGCVVGGVIQGVFGGVTTNAFVFTSLLTIPAFSNIPVYAVSVLAAFFTAMVLVIISDYRTSEDRAEVDAIAAQNEADATLEAAQAAAAQEPATTALTPGAVTELVAPLSGTVMAVEAVADPVFASGATSSSRLRPQAPWLWRPPPATPTASRWTTASRSWSTWASTPSTWRARASMCGSARGTAWRLARSWSGWTVPSLRRPATR